MGCLPLITKIRRFHLKKIREQKKEINESLRLPYSDQEYRMASKRYSLRSRKIDNNFFWQKLKEADVIIVGDYHDYTQSHKFLLSLLGELVKERHVHLGLEALLIDKEEQITKTLKNGMTKQSFGRLVGLSWKDDWQIYKPLFDFAKENQKENRIHIYGLFKKGISRNESDRIAGSRIYEMIKKYPQEFHIIFFGEEHLCPDHLPLQCGLDITQVLITQNITKLYYNKQFSTDVEIYQLLHSRNNMTRFCVLYASPLEKYHTYLLELNNKDITFLEEDFTELINFFEKLFSLKGSSTFNIHELPLIVPGYGDIKKTDTICRGDYPYTFGDLHTGIHRITSLDDSLFAYLSQPYLYLIAHAASSAIRASYLEPSLSSEENQEHLFYSNVLTEALGFMGSLIINPKRKLKTPEELMKFSRTTLEQKFASNVCEYIEIEENVKVDGSVKNDCSSDGSNVGKFIGSLDYVQRKNLEYRIGSFLGEKLFCKLMNGEIAIKDIKELYTPHYNNLDAKEKYFELQKKLHNK